MKVEQEKKIEVKFQDLNEFIYSIENLSKWISYIDSVEQVTITQDLKGSYLNLKIKLFGKQQAFNFRVSEFEKAKKIRLKSYSPYFFEITIKTFQAVDNLSYVVLKTKVKPMGGLKIFYTFNRKKLSLRNKLSLDILSELYSKN